MKRPEEIESKYGRRAALIVRSIVLVVGYWLYSVTYKSAIRTFKEAMDIKARMKRAW